MNPKFITVHCSASPPSSRIGATEIRQMHLNRGWSDIGYHFIIERDGKIVEGRPTNIQGAHVSGHNKDNIGVCLVGGVNEQLKPEANYTQHQMTSLSDIIDELMSKYAIPSSNVKGHRDWFGDTNKDGVVDSRDWLKACPCFDVRQWMTERVSRDNLTFEQVIKSISIDPSLVYGRRVWGDSVEIRVRGKYFYIHVGENLFLYHLSVDDLLADDWFIQ